MNTITPKNSPEEFVRICLAKGISYPSTVHHFEKESDGTHKTVLWCDIQPTYSEGRKNDA